MSLKFEYVRKSVKILGASTSEYSDGSTTERGADGCVLGHISEQFNATRDSSQKLISTNTASPGLLIRGK